MKIPDIMFRDINTRTKVWQNLYNQPEWLFHLNVFTLNYSIWLIYAHTYTLTGRLLVSYYLRFLKLKMCVDLIKSGK